MIKPEQVPKKVVRAAEKAWEKDEESFRPNAKTIAAAINAWPNRVTVKDDGRRQTYIIPAIILPLTPQEASDE